MSNLAGIIPIAGPKTDIELPWHHVMMPFDRNKLLIQNSVYTCAMAGCSSIWIICNDDIQPVIKSVVGDQIQDPVYKHRSFAKFAKDHQKLIPIFYVPMPIRDLYKKNNYAWSAVHGSLMASKIFGQISSYVAPERFFISWPYAVVDSKAFRQHRQNIKKQSIIFECDGKSIFTDDYLPVCCNIEEIRQIKDYCYELQNPHSLNKVLTHLRPSELLKPLGKKKKVTIECNYSRVASWQDYLLFLRKKSVS